MNKEWFTTVLADLQRCARENNLEMTEEYLRCALEVFPKEEVHLRLVTSNGILLGDCDQSA
ncbi:hypothetical protein [Roseobacter sp.]|uniref:hypothetical protein n=1 Tax=Roseobacter sp. TaxID=1907202 RepID=UPI0025DC2201|nr:hypothetical protein [Roseobacter sp.]